MPSEEVRNWLESIVDVINEDSKAKEELDKWIGTYFGKVLEWHIGDDKFFLILSPGKARIGEGEYPSPEIVITSDSNTWMELIRGEELFNGIKSYMKEERIVVKGNLNEAYNFSNFLKAAGPSLSMTSEDVRNWLEGIVDIINDDSKAKEELDKWIGTYFGKILEWHIGEDKFFLILAPGKARIEEGEYPSPEIVITSDPNTWMGLTKKDELFDGIKSYMKEGRIIVKGNLNEAYNFSNLVKAVGK